MSSIIRLSSAERRYLARAVDLGRSDDTARALLSPTERDDLLRRLGGREGVEGTDDGAESLGALLACDPLFVALIRNPDAASVGAAYEVSFGARTDGDADDPRPLQPFIIGDAQPEYQALASILDREYVE